MEPRYVRNLQALSEAEYNMLRTKKVAVIGCGGLGGYLIEMLARLGIGSILAVDGDVFEATNLNRQLLSAPEMIGKSKAWAAAERIRRINPDVSVSVAEVFLNEENAVSLIGGYDVVLDGLDNIDARKVLADACRKLGIPYVFGAIQGWVAQAAISMPGDDLIQRLYPDDVEVADHSVLSFTPALCASMQVSLCTKILVGQPVESGKIWYIDLYPMEFESIPML
jgi:molybdopterin/thiamine biosynthesis adenylyltransferase